MSCAAPNLSRLISRAWIGKCGSRHWALTAKTRGSSTFVSGSSKVRHRSWPCWSETLFLNIRPVSSVHEHTITILPPSPTTNKPAPGGNENSTAITFRLRSLQRIYRGVLDLQIKLLQDLKSSSHFHHGENLCCKFYACAAARWQTFSTSCNLSRRGPSIRLRSRTNCSPE